MTSLNMKNTNIPENVDRETVIVTILWFYNVQKKANSLFTQRRICRGCERRQECAFFFLLQINNKNYRSIGEVCSSTVIQIIYPQYYCKEELKWNTFISFHFYIPIPSFCKNRHGKEAVKACCCNHSHIKMGIIWFLH